MKNLWRKIASGALALAMMFTLAACGKENGGADAASVMVAAQQELTKVSSMRYTYAMEMAISAEGQSVEMNVDKFIMSMEVLGYNDVDAITVPQEVLDSAADVTEEAG